MSVISISLPDGMVADVDRFLAERSYAGRSELIRAALRDFFAREPADFARKGSREASLTLVYPKGTERRLGLTRHEFSDVIKSMMHADSDQDCTELYLLHGAADRVQEFVETLRGDRDVKIAQVVFTDQLAKVRKPGPTNP
jgi:CopG family transcriptional regulator, nickel-responsive regulator